MTRFCISPFSKSMISNPYNTKRKRDESSPSAPKQVHKEAAGGKDRAFMLDDDDDIDWSTAAELSSELEHQTKQRSLVQTNQPLVERHTNGHPRSAAPVQHHLRPPRPAMSSSMAALRPQAWTNNNRKAAPSPATKSSPGRQLHLNTSSPQLESILLDPLQASLPACLRFAPDAVKPVQDDFRKALVQQASLSERLDNGWTLFSHQKKAILRGLLQRRLVLALDMGMGKTLTALVWARAFCRVFGTKVIVICPTSLKSEWKRTAEQATGLVVEDNLTCTTTNNVYICTWSKIPTKINVDYVVIADEAHNMQSMDAGRTKNALALMKDCRGVLLLTGTPMKNGRPANLFPLLLAVRHPLSNNRRAFEEYFCEGRECNFGGKKQWVASGARNLKQLQQLVSSHVLYLTKDEVLKSLPPQTRVVHHVPVSSKSQIEHDRCLKELCQIASAPERNPDAILGLIQRVRQKGSFAKIEASVQYALQILEKEPAVVIFSGFVEVAKSIHRKLAEAGWPGELLTGETAAAKRADMVDRFQSGVSPVFCCTFGAGGVGLTLTAARTVVLVDRPWTPGEAMQAEDRVRRIGQKFPVTSIWISAFELDKHIDAMLEQKKKTAVAVLDDKADASSEEAPRKSIIQMFQEVLPRIANGRGNHASGDTNNNDGKKQMSILPFTQPSPNK